MFALWRKNIENLEEFGEFKQVYVYETSLATLKTKLAQLRFNVKEFRSFTKKRMGVRREEFLQFFYELSIPSITHDLHMKNGRKNWK